MEVRGWLAAVSADRLPLRLEIELPTQLSVLPFGTPVLEVRVGSAYPLPTKPHFVVGRHASTRAIPRLAYQAWLHVDLDGAPLTTADDRLA